MVAAKSDLITDPEAVDKFEKATGKRPIVISALAREGLDTLLTVIKKAVDELPPVGRMQAEDDSPLDGIRDTDFAVEEVEEGVFEVTGGLVDFPLAQRDFVLLRLLLLLPEGDEGQGSHRPL